MTFLTIEPIANFAALLCMLELIFLACVAVIAAARRRR